ncbi:MAG TPA: biopolymer transporter ExbD [Bryobacteraceae bacterium]|nr:biopolymer transporter ExbD [Bryobacteraceae bacterium]
MAISVGGNSRQKAEMNVTPMIDILLVLIIIFLLVTPQLSHGLKTSAPESSDERASAPRDDIVVTVFGNRTVRLNQESLTLEDLDARLRTVFKNAPNHVIFVRADKDLDFQPIAEVIDIAKGAGLERVALMPR